MDGRSLTKTTTTIITTPAISTTRASGVRGNVARGAVSFEITYVWLDISRRTDRLTNKDKDRRTNGVTGGRLNMNHLSLNLISCIHYDL